jgi:hypothetical protein
MGPIRLLIADDHPVVRDGLRASWPPSQMELVGEAAPAPRPSSAPARCDRTWC